ncbi:MAG: cytochrome c biogenesis protein [Deltaproteobacteria bacterium]|nr:cytochrome c biogenesis protein [Deltaproteobacteria bacterium]
MSMVRFVPVLLLAIAAALFPSSVHTIFLDTPIERQLGTVQKIFYFHVPLAWIMMLFGVVCGIAAGLQLRRHSRVAEAIAVASGEMVIVAGLAVLITGPIWGHASWGHAWTWDARQITTGLLWLVFVAYILVRRYGAAGSERLAAALAIFGAVDVPVIYYAVKIWKTTHPSTDTVGSLPSSMWTALWPALGALLATAVAIVWIRARQELTEMDLDDAWVDAEDLGAAKGEAT